MPYQFCPGYYSEPFLKLCENYPDESIYPKAKFRTEWGPIFHRGRLDGTAQILIIGQDPAQNENIAHRILVGTAGRRVQGFLTKLGIDKSYVMINSFLYSMYGNTGAKMVDDPSIAQYRNLWLDALVNQNIKGVAACGVLADKSWQLWKATPQGQKFNPVYVKIIHPTEPESASNGDPAKWAAETKKLLENWNSALQKLHPAITNPDYTQSLALYGNKFTDAEMPPVPACDYPAGTPKWMREGDNWSKRVGSTTAKKRATIQITVPDEYFTN